MENGIIDNQEDSIVLNKAAIDRGLFDADTLKKYGSVLEMNPSTSSDDIFMKPDRTKVTGMTQGNYEKINEEGFIPEETAISDKDMIIGKVSPIQPTGDNKVFKDKSEMFKSNVDGHVDRVHHDVYDGDGYKMVNMRVRMERVPIIGDKFCVRETSYIKTESGWIQIKELKPEMKLYTLKNNQAYLSDFTELNIFECQNEPMLVYQKGNLTIETTFGHRYYVQEEGQNTWKFITARELYQSEKNYYVKNPVVGKILLDKNYFQVRNYSGKVMCPSVPKTQLFLYRENMSSIPVWTGNSTRFGQKGTLGLLLDQRDMPFTEEGMIPDIIFNPHGYPSRETVGQLLETICGKYAASTGKLFDGTPFDDYDVYKIPDLLKKIGYHPYGIETMYNGITGQKMQAQIFIGPVYYMRLKHMVNDKMHCLTPDHEVLTENGWKNITQVSKEDKVASLVNNQLEYHHPLNTFEYDYQGKMYSIKSQLVNQCVTPNHKMYVSKLETRKRIWSNYELIEAKEIYGKHRKYKRNADLNIDDYQFILPSVISNNIKIEEKKVDMNSWLTFFGIWIAEGWCNQVEKNNSVYSIEISVNKQRVKDNLYPSLKKLGYNFRVDNEKLRINNKQLYEYMKQFSVKAPNKFLPKWVWNLSKSQSNILMNSMILGDGSYGNLNQLMYYTSSEKLADDFTRLALHAGWSSNKIIHIPKGNSVAIKEKNKVRNFTNNNNIYRLSVIKNKNEPSVNHGHKNNTFEEKWIDYSGKVYCLEVPSNIFYVRKDGIPSWTGNSRATGPKQAITRQPLEGRAKDGGLKIGERLPKCICKYVLVHVMVGNILKLREHPVLNF